MAAARPISPIDARPAQLGLPLACARVLRFAQQGYTRLPLGCAQASGWRQSGRCAARLGYRPLRGLLVLLGQRSWPASPAG